MMFGNSIITNLSIKFVIQLQDLLVLDQALKILITKRLNVKKTVTYVGMSQILHYQFIQIDRVHVGLLRLEIQSVHRNFQKIIRHNFDTLLRF